MNAFTVLGRELFFLNFHYFCFLMYHSFLPYHLSVILTLLFINYSSCLIHHSFLLSYLLIMLTFLFICLFISYGFVYFLKKTGKLIKWGKEQWIFGRDRDWDPQWRALTAHCEKNTDYQRKNSVNHYETFLEHIYLVTLIRENQLISIQERIIKRQYSTNQNFIPQNNIDKNTEKRGQSEKVISPTAGEKTNHGCRHLRCDVCTGKARLWCWGWSLARCPPPRQGLWLRPAGKGRVSSGLVRLPKYTARSRVKRENNMWHWIMSDF